MQQRGDERERASEQKFPHSTLHVRCRKATTRGQQGCVTNVTPKVVVRTNSKPVNLRIENCSPPVTRVTRPGRLCSSPHRCSRPSPSFSSGLCWQKGAGHEGFKQTLKPVCEERGCSSGAGQL